ncbi:MAG: cupin domain-containing protein [Candidatus Sumerlaeia bacterium]|nr:cupin domain-containing protein [Candidatus Sumerlaeia bacterium]
MIVRNFLDHPVVEGPAHGGAGSMRSAFLYGAEDFATALRFVIHTEIPPGASIGYHTHGNNEEVYVILEGGGVMTVNGEARRVRAGDVLLNKPGWSHGLANDTDAPLRILVFEVDGK